MHQALRPLDELLVGDVDRVVFISATNADQVLRTALDNIAAEDMTRAELAFGESLRIVRARYGVL